MAIWVIKDGQREGPYEDQDVRELVYEGTYSDGDPAIRDGQFDWTSLGLLLGREEAAIQAGEPAPIEPLPAEPPPMPAEPAPAEAPAAAARHRAVRVSVIDFDMPFGSMVVLMMKWVLASIPALLILGAVLGFLAVVFLGILSVVVGR
jgi:hypothetical protein